MRRSRLYTNQPLACPGEVTLDAAASHYLARVLRLSPGDALTLFNGDGQDYQGELLDAGKPGARVRLVTRCEAAAESPLEITLVQAVSRGERMDHTLQKATELGVHRIQPILSERVEVRLDDKRRGKRMAHWRGVVASACEQSGRALVPAVDEPLELRDWLAANRDGSRLVLAPDARDRLSRLKLGPSPVWLVVGPEGGFAPAELSLLEGGGVMPVALGPRILRTETAGPAAIAVLQALAGDV